MKSGGQVDTEIETDRVNKENDSESYELVYSDEGCMPQVYFSWSNITYTVKNSTILNSVSGFANPNEILAIMGSSGCGKTSLLSILSHKLLPNNIANISGSVQLNGKNIKNFKYQTYCRFVTQQNILLPTLTPRESLLFAARLKTKGSINELNERVEILIQKLNIQKSADNIIGSNFIKGLSGGEKKRVCIGMEMIANPLILILDDPTSGLDSYTAKIIINVLKEEANSGKTVIMTIHQPGKEIYEKFDRLILMIAGNFVYQGPRSEAQKYFFDLGYPCPLKTLPQDHFMRVLFLKNSRSLTPEEDQKLKFLNSCYTLPDKPKANERILPYSMNDFHLGILRTFEILFKRSNLNARRNPGLFKVKIIQAVLIGTVLSLNFRDLGYGYVQLKNRAGLLYFVTMNTTMFGNLVNSTAFPAERPMFLKDYKEGLYGVVPYYYSKFLGELPFAILFSLLYSLIMYFSCDLNRESPKHYFIFFGVITLTHVSGMCLGNLAGIIAPNSGTAILLALTLIVPWLLFGGYFINTKSLNTSFSWVKYISSLSRGYEALILNEFDGLQVEDNIDVPDSLGFYGEIWQKVGGLLLIIGVVMVLGVIALKIKVKISI